MEGKKYSFALRLMHWVMAVIILLLILMGFFMVNFSIPNEKKYVLYGCHKSLGVMVFTFFFLRISIRFFSYLPDLPKFISRKAGLVVDLTHYLMYVAIFLVPLSGILMSSFAGYPIKFFGYELPSVFIINKQYSNIAHNLHSILAYLLLALVVLHIGGVIKHWIFDKQNILKRMV